MKVYVVIYDYYDILEVLGVFTTRDKALEFAIMTAPDKRDPELIAKLDAIAGRVL